MQKPAIRRDCRQLGMATALSRLTFSRQSETLQPSDLAFWGIAMRYRIAAIGFVVAVGALSMTQQAQAQAATSAPQLSRPMASDLSAQTRRRPRVRIRIYREDERGVYPSYFPGPNAVRDCTATYVKEYRPSGTVIVPRMNCFWRPG
jgi:hypothetical protein